MTRLAFLLLLLFPFTALAEPGASEWTRQPEVSVRLLSASSTAGTAPSLDLGVEIELAQGWHTYWRSPGDAGAPATLDWTGSQGLVGAELLWPAPKRMLSQGIQSVGYDQSTLILPLRATLEPEQAVQLRAKLDLLVCADLCIPYTFDLALDLPKGAAEPTAFAKRLDKWNARVPVAKPDVLQSAEIFDGQLRVFLKTEPALDSPDIIVESENGFRFGKPMPLVGYNGPYQAYGLPLEQTLKAGETLEGKTYRLTVLDSTQNLDITDVKPVTSAPAQLPEQRLPLAYALLIALVGGLILNLMPCVLPVLSLKILSVASHAGAPASHVRLSFLANAAGIITSFLVLAGIAIALKQAGINFGWGVQFQHPAFVVPMVIILTLFAASLWNFIHIPLPRFLADAINDKLPTGQGHDRTLVGNFLTGAFATLLATPCSAPFVGTAIGFALTGSTLDILIISLAMGLGLATPYLLIAAFPGFAKHLPRPGRWMEWLKKVLGLALLITALWLASVLAPQIGPQTAQLVGGSMLVLMLALWIRASFTRPILFLKGIGVLVLIALLSMGANQLTIFSPPTAPLRWLVFNESKIPELVKAGKIVFVDVTADWCLTCKANKRFVLEAEPTITRLRDDNIILMQADWTARSDAIGAYLAKHKRYGIPFNIVYGPAAPDGVAMTELLSAAKVEQALQQAGHQPK